MVNELFKLAYDNKLHRQQQNYYDVTTFTKLDVDKMFKSFVHLILKISLLTTVSSLTRTLLVYGIFWGNVRKFRIVW